MRWILLATLSLLLSAITVFAIAALALLYADRATRSDTTMVIRDGTDAWLVRQHYSFGLWWVNCEQLDPPLVNQVPTLMDIPEWAFPPRREWTSTDVPRAAALGVGWPSPFMSRQWESTTVTPPRLFPLPFESDNGSDSLRRAAEFFLESDPALPRRVVWTGLAIDIALFWIAWAALIGLSQTLRRALLHREKRHDEAHKHE